MAELADAYGSGPYESNFMRVRVPFSAPKEIDNFRQEVVDFFCTLLSSLFSQTKKSITKPPELTEVNSGG